MSATALRDEIKLQLDTQLGAAPPPFEADRLKIAQAFADAIDPHFLHAGESADPATSTPPGMVKTDTDPVGDPVVYLKESVDGLLVGKANVVHSHAFSEITGKPSTLAGYGIMDAAPANHNHDGSYLKLSGGAISGLLTVSRAGDGVELLRFDAERRWSFFQRGTGAGAALELRPEFAGKSFIISNDAGTPVAEFHGSSTQVNRVDLIPSGGIARVAGNTIWHAGNLSKEELAVVSLSDKTIYVNPSTGNDATGEGTSGKPFKTIARALQAIPDLVRHTYTIQLAAGVYRESLDIQKWGIRAARGNSNDFPAKIILLGDPANPSAVRITGANAGAETTAVRYEGISIEGSALVRLDGVLIDYYTRAGVHVIGGQVEFGTVVIENVGSVGLWAEDGARIGLAGANLTIRVNNTSSGLGAAFYNNCSIDGDPATTQVYIYNAAYGWYQTSGTTALNIGTLNVSNEGAAKGIWGVVVWAGAALHGFKVHVNNYQKGLIAANLADVDIDSPSSFTNVDTAIDSGGTTFMDVDGVTFTNVVQKYRVGPGGFVDATGESSTGKMLYQLQGASPTADGASAVAHWIDTVSTYSSGKLFSIRSGGSEKLYVAHDGNIYVGSNKVWHAGNDGSGSGLDADRLDGLHASSFALAGDKTDNYIWVRHNSTSPAFYVTNQSTGNIVSFRSGAGDGTERAYITNEGNVYAPAFLETSSRSLKKDIEDFEEDALALVLGVRIRTFAFKNEPHVRRIGIIAEETDLVFTGPNRDGFSLPDSLAITMRAVQQLAAENERLKKENADLRVQVATITSLVQSLVDRVELLEARV